MHQTARWTARHSYVALAFILIILALILAGCASANREESGTPTAAIVGHTDLAIFASASNRHELTRQRCTRSA